MYSALYNEELGDVSIFTFYTLSKAISKRVLLIEDYRNVLEGLGYILSGEGFHVTGAMRGLQALDILKNDRFDFIISELNLPDIDGISLYEKVKKLNLNINYFLISDFDDILDYNVAKQLGIKQIFKKPFDLDNLVETLNASNSDF
jgi:DNA-binding NtrC family response regulator